MGHNAESWSRRQQRVRTAIDEAKHARHEADRLALIAWNMKLWAGGNLATFTNAEAGEDARLHAPVLPVCGLQNVG